MTTYTKGDYAMSVETQWVGRVDGLEQLDSLPLVRLHGVDLYAMWIDGQTPEQAVDHSDVQWFTPEDLVKVKMGQGSIVLCQD